MSTNSKEFNKKMAMKYRMPVNATAAERRAERARRKRYDKAYNTGEKLSQCEWRNKLYHF
jgi:hypothetical protein